MRSPIAAPSGGVTSSTVLPSALLAHITMACDFMPLMLTGFKLASTTTRRFCISASGMNFTRPEITVRGSASPTSISSTYRLSASGCLLAFRISPTRRFRRDTSTGGSGALAAGAPLSFFGFTPSAPLPLLSFFPASPSALAVAVCFAGAAALGAGTLAAVASEPAEELEASATRSACEPEKRRRSASTSSSEILRNSGSGFPPRVWPTGMSVCRPALQPEMNASSINSAEGSRLSC
mmetsp:Transcript_1047/g.1838  ORF Transcript_1047/g.1838 Transcript_1047/m.1838 type:complete len:237 (-) Transcript_1047:1802-2512(-)